MDTIETLKSLEDTQFVSKEEAANLAKIALKEFSKRSNAAKDVEKSVWDMALAGGCPNAVVNKVILLATRYAHPV